jgi:hypothetical protein
MSKKFTARDKTTQKMTKDGLVEQNAVTGESTRISNRNTDMDLGGGSRKNADRPLSSERKNKPEKMSRKQVSRQDPDTTATDANAATFESGYNAPAHPHSIHSTSYTVMDSPHPEPSYNNDTSQAGDIPNSKLHTSRADIVKPESPHKSLQKPKSVKAQAKKIAKKPAQSLKTSKNRLQFAKDEASPSKPKSTKSITERKFRNAERKLERSINKLNKAYQDLPTRRNVSKIVTIERKSGEKKSKLKFENPSVLVGNNLKNLIHSDSAEEVTNQALGFWHDKMHEVENENVGTKAAHRADKIVESGARSAYRMHKNAPYRKVQKLERKVAKRKINFSKRYSTVQNKKAQKNRLLRASQKRKIRRSYAKTARNAQKAAAKAKKAGTVGKLGKALAGLIKRNPKVILIFGLLIVMILIMMSACNAGGNLFGGSITSIVLTSYLAQDHDMLGAEAVYAGMEADLQYMLDNYETLNPGYDEYIYELDSIWHDPYVLISMLHAYHDLEWTLSEVQGTLAWLFDLQYTLTETETVEIRTQIETVIVTVIITDPETGEEYEEEHEEEIEVEYEYWIMTVTLENANLSHLPVYTMSHDQLSRYATLMRTLGNRPDLFPISQYPNASFSMEYGRYDIPPEYFGDEVFAAIIAEAEKYLGFPYVWGGSHPSTSFDCSGFVSWVYNQSGWNFGRLGAKALFNISTPISPANARPGDLVFFIGTYNAPDPNAPTHVGIYVGDGMMLHCGNPIGYVSIETAYWQRHFYSFARP